MVDSAAADGLPPLDYMARDYESLLQVMCARIPEKLPEWRSFTNEADFGRVLLELFAHMGDILSYYQDRVANESFLATARTRRSVVEHLRLIGYELGTAAPAAATLALSVPDGVDELVFVNPGDAFATSSRPDKPSIRFEYLGSEPFPVDFRNVTADPVTKRKTVGADEGGIPVREGRLFRNELLGHSDGTPNQRFPLVHPQVILRPPGREQQVLHDVRIETRLVDAVTMWTRRDSLALSRGRDADYVVEVDADARATVVFGDGRSGEIPPAGSTVSASYRVGGGQAGNVPPHAISTIVDAPALARLGATVLNPRPATGGADREETADAVRRAPAVFRSTHRAVTAADYEALALSFRGVGKVRAVSTGWNQVTLYVAPEGGGNVSDVLEADLLGFFEDKRMLSQIVEISDVDYVPIHVTAEVTAEPFYVPAEVLARVREAAGKLLTFDRVGFGETVYLSRFYEEIQNVPGVVSVDISEFRRGDRPQPLVADRGAIALGPNEVPTVPTHPDYVAGLKATLADRGRR
jgi:hypothetical protein